jgi:hypothetical protein
MQNLSFRHPTPRASKRVRSSRSHRQLDLRVALFERRQLLSDATPSPTVCPNCGGSHNICVSGDPAWQMQVAEQLGLASSNGPEYQIGGRWSSTVTNPSTGSAGNPVTLTWGFVADGLSIPGFNGEPTAGSNLQARLNTIYGSSTTWLPIFQSIYDRWSAVSGLSYSFFGLSDDGAAFGSSGGVAGVRPDIRISGHNVDGASNVLAYNFYPANGGDMVIDTGDLTGSGYMTNTSSNSLRLRNVIAHEHGHGLGLAHVMPVPGDASAGGGTKLMEPFVSTNFDGPQFDDILAAQFNYGDPFEKNGRNDTAATANSFGTLGASGNLTNSSLSAWVNANNPTSPRSIANGSDLDFFSFTITEAKNVSFTVSPFGPTYNQGPQTTPATTPTLFNASAQGDLSIAIISSNGSTVLSTANATGLGSSETVSVSNLAAGTYYLRVGINAATSTSTPTQAYNISTSIASTIVVAPPAPSAPNLTAGSDSGRFNNDRVTNDNTPTFTGTAEVGSTVNILFNGVSVGSAVATTGSYFITTSARPDGVYSVTATATNSAGTGPASGSITVTIDTTAPLAPQNLRVLAADDTGLSSSDNITNIKTPRLTGDAEANSAVDIAGPGTFAGNFTGGAGFIASFGTATLPEGTSNIIATTTDLAGNSSTGIASLNVIVDTIAPAAPTGNALFTNDDTGVSSTDGLTRVKTPRVAGSAENNARVDVLQGTTVLASGTSSSGSYLTAALPPRPDGAQSYIVRATDVAGNASTDASITFTVDTVAPTVASVSFVRSDRQSAFADFSEPIGTPGNFNFRNNTTSTNTSATPFVVDADTIEYRVVGNTLTDGVYTADFGAGGLTDLAGNPAFTPSPALSFNYLRADFNNTSTVNFDDLLILAANYNGTGNNSQGDANYDGAVNFDDLLILAASYNTSLPGTASIVAPPPANSPTADDAGNPPGIAADVL